MEVLKADKSSSQARNHMFSTQVFILLNVKSTICLASARKSYKKNQTNIVKCMSLILFETIFSTLLFPKLSKNKNKIFPSLRNF